MGADAAGCPAFVLEDCVASLVFWEPVVAEPPDDAEPVPVEPDDTESVGVVEGDEDPVVDEPDGGVVTTVLSAEEGVDDPEDNEVFVSDPDADATGVEELDPADVDDESDVVATSAGSDDVDPDEVGLVEVVSLEDDDGELVVAEVADVDPESVDTTGEPEVVEVCCSDSVSFHQVARRFLREYWPESAVGV